MYVDELDDPLQSPESPRPPSKSQRKRDAIALQKLGEDLVQLTPAQLKQIPLPEDLLTAVRAAQAMPQRGAHKRQLQYIGKLMRQIDDLEPIQTALNRTQTPQRPSQGRSRRP